MVDVAQTEKAREEKLPTGWSGDKICTGGTQGSGRKVFAN